MDNNCATNDFISISKNNKTHDFQKKITEQMRKRLFGIFQLIRKFNTRVGSGKYLWFERRSNMLIVYNFDMRDKLKP